MSKVRKNFNNKNVKTKVFRKNNFLNFFTILLFLIFGFCGFYYINMTNKSATSGYVIADLKTEKEILKNTYERLELNAIELKRATEIEKRAKNDLNMVKSGNVEYLQDKMDIVAVR